MTIRVNGLDALLRPTDRVPGLRRDGREPAARSGRRGASRSGRGAPTWVRTRSSRACGSRSRRWKRHDQNSLPVRRRRPTARTWTRILAKVESLKAGYDEAIMLNDDGVRHRRLGRERVHRARTASCSPRPPASVASTGVTRGAVITLARDLGYQVHERNLVRTDLYMADEVFFTGTAAELTPIREVDDRVVGAGHRGPVTKELQDAFFAATKGENPRTATGSPTSTTEARRWVDFRSRIPTPAVGRPRSRYDLTIEPDLDRRRSPARTRSPSRVHEPVTEIVLNAKELEVLELAMAADRLHDRREGRPGPGVRTGDARARRAAADRGVDPPPPFPRNAERSDGRLLPLALRRRGPGARRRHHPLRGDRRPDVLPVLGRAGPQGDLRRSRSSWPTA